MVSENLLNLINTNNSNHISSIHQFFLLIPFRFAFKAGPSCHRARGHIRMSYYCRLSVCVGVNVQTEKCPAALTRCLRFTFNMETFKHLYCWVHSSCHSFHHISRWDGMVMRYFFFFTARSFWVPYFLLGWTFFWFDGRC